MALTELRRGKQSDFFLNFAHTMKTQECNIWRATVPAGICITGCMALLLPGASPLAICLGWMLAYVAVAVPYTRSSCCTRAGALTLFLASLLLASGIIINCHYYIYVWGEGLDASRPVLMNLDAWSAWNNALVDLGREDAYPCHWPAVGYGHFVGQMLAIFGPDICIPLIFNAFCTIAAIALTGSIAQQCAGGTESERRRISTVAMIFTAAMCYFMASGTVLIKDTPLAAAVALTAWAGLRLRAGRLLLPAVAVAAATYIVVWLRPNYLLVLTACIAASAFRERRILRLHAATCIALGILWIILQLSENASSIANYIDFSLRGMSDDSDGFEQHSVYYRIFSDYYSFPAWQRFLLLPITTAIQFIIPLPWTAGKYLIFGPFMAWAHFSLCRYAAGGLIMYFCARQLSREGRAPAMLLSIGAVGLLFYTGAALQFGGTVSRYGIPLVSLLIPCAAYAWTNYRHERAFGIWAAVFAAGMTGALFICYSITT